MTVADETTDPDPLRTEALSAADVVQSHQAAVWRQLRALGAGPETAADLAQEAFLLLLRQRGPDLHGHSQGKDKQGEVAGKSFHLRWCWWTGKGLQR